MSSQQTNNYRYRLMLTGMIRPVGRGYVEYVYPNTKRWLTTLTTEDATGCSSPEQVRGSSDRGETV